MTATCSAPLPRWPSSCAPRAMTLEERIRANPYITATMTSESVILGVPLNSILLVNYEAASSGERDIGLDAAVVAGIPRCMYFGKIISREAKRGGGVAFRMLCFNRGVPGVGAIRTFSTRAGKLHGVVLMQLPPVEAAS